MRVASGILVGAALMLSGACATVSEVPTTKLSQAKAAIRAAEEVGAKEVPAASLHLKLAQDKVETAGKLLAKGDRDDAAAMLDRATADAEVAVVLTRAEEERMRADEAEARLLELKRHRAESQGGEETEE